MEDIYKSNRLAYENITGREVLIWFIYQQYKAS